MVFVLMGNYPFIHAQTFHENMDSVTQALLGATTFALVKDKEIGKKSLLIGAVAGTIPDFDVFLKPFYHEVEFLTVHRGFSPSILLAVILSLFCGEIFYRWYKKKQSRRSWLTAFFLAFMTHSLLDVCTTYGTQLFSPFSNHLFSTNNIHVFEPVYTLILLTGVIVLYFRKNTGQSRQKILNLALFISTLYLGWTFISKRLAEHHFTKEVTRQNIDFENIKVSPTTLNSVLWHGIIKTDKGYYFGTWSLFDVKNDITFYFEESVQDLPDSLQQHRLIQNYLHYSDEFPLIKKDDTGHYWIYAIKYGPINYMGKPEFVYPLIFHENDLAIEKIKIEYSGKQRGPIKNYRKLLERVIGIQKPL
jgi:inner membrane protein